MEMIGIILNPETIMSSVTTDLNLCKTQGFSDAEILVFKDGIQTSLEQILKSFK